MNLEVQPRTLEEMHRHPFSSETPYGDAFTQYQNSSDFLGYSPNTQKSYGRDLKQFGAYLKELGLVSVGELTSDILSEYIKHRSKDLSNISLKRIIASLSRCAKWVNGKLPEDSRISLEGNVSERREELRPLNPLSEGQILRLLNAAKGSTRDSALLTIALSTGAKPSETVSLNIEDIIEGTEAVEVRFRGKKERTIELSKEASEALRRQKEEVRDNEGDSPLFLNQPNHKVGNSRLTRQGFWMIVGKYGETIGVSNLTPKKLRETFITNLHTNDSKELALILGITENNVYKILKRRRLTQ